MYNVIETKESTVIILKKLFNEVLPLFKKTVESLNQQQTQDDLYYWVCDIFDEDFEEEHGIYSDEYLQKFAICVLNIKHFLIQDKDKFCDDFNDEDLKLEIGYDKGYYPCEIGNWYDRLEIVITLKD